MLTIESGIILNDNNVIHCKYYEIEETLKKIIEEYSLENENLNKKFQEFKAKYKTFKPYFDFAVTELGIKVLNPFLKNGEMFTCDKDKNIIKITEDGKSIFEFPKCDDETLDIHHIGYSSSLWSDCIIDGIGNKIMKYSESGHISMINLILNLLLISNKKVAEDFLKSEFIERGQFLSRYYPFIRFRADKEGNMFITECVYRELNATKEMMEFMEYLLDNRYTYPSYLRKIDSHDNIDSIMDFRESLKNDYIEVKKDL